MINLKYSVGIDGSKKDFKACISIINTLQEVKVKSSATFTNTPAGFDAFFKWVFKHKKEQLPVFYLMEATGIYNERLAWFLYNKGQKCTVILPNKAKKYLQSTGLKTKNDKIDAQGLARMGAEQNLPLWQPLSKNIYTLRSLTRLHESLTKQRTTLNNQLHAIEFSMYELKEVFKGLTTTLKAIDKQLVLVEKQIQTLIDKDSLIKSKYDKISRIKGIGVLSFAVIVAETNGFEAFANQKQLVSYAGYDVIENQSGSKISKTRISKKGNNRIRRILHMPALTTVTHNEPIFKSLFDRVYNRTGVKMKAYVAVQKKLLCLFYALWKRDEAYNPNFSNETITSGNEEPKPLFSLGSEGSIKIIAPA
jgi:transposase